MTINTRRLDVSSQERELGHIMVKRLCVQPNDVGVATVVLGMAMLALNSIDVWNCTVKAAASGYVLIDFFVAEKAKVILSTFSKGAMTLFTGTFELGVVAYNRPWHYQRFQYSSDRCGRLQHEEDSDAKRNPHSHGSQN